MTEKLTDRVYRQMRDEIMTGGIGSDDLLQEQQVASRYGVSKVTAREVLQRLCHEKYLKSLPRKGYLILDLTPGQLNMMQKLRYQVEALALKEIVKNCADADLDALAAVLATPSDARHDPYGTLNSRFHLKIAELSGNPYLYDTMYGYIGSICRYAMTAGKGVVIDTDNHHRQMLDALRRRDIQAALEELRLDLQLSEDEV